MFDPFSIINLTEDLGIIQAVRGKLTVQKDPAAETLAAVLDELSKVIGTLHEEIRRYLGRDAMKQLAAWLVTEAGQTLDDVSSENLIGANQSIAQAPTDVREARELLTRAMVDLRGLQADFTSVSGTV